jgi:hypothetical protein
MTMRPEDEPQIALSFGRLAIAAVLWPVVVGALWGAGAWLGGFGDQYALGGLVAGPAMAVIGVGALVVLGPWRAKPLTQWPFLWLAKTLGELVGTPVVGFLLYSATPLGGAALLLPLVATYWASLIGQTRSYAAQMSRLAPPRAREAASEIDTDAAARR